MTDVPMQDPILLSHQAFFTNGSERLSLLNVHFEVLEYIVLLLPPQDLLRFAQSSKACYDLALPLLYRNLDLVVGINPLPNKKQHASMSSDASKRNKDSHKAAAASMRCTNFLLSQPVLLASVRHLRVSERRWDSAFSGYDIRLPLESGFGELPAEPPRSRGRRHDTTWNPFHFLIPQNRFPERLREFMRPPVSSTYAQTFQAINSTLAILPHLVHLTNLTLRTITLPKNFFPSIQALAEFGNLRVLTLRHVRATSHYPRVFDPTALRLTELNLFGIYARTSPLKAILKLARSSTLTKLRLDRSLERALKSLITFGLPPSVIHLALDFRGVSANPVLERTPLAPMFTFLNACGAYIEHLELVDVGKVDNISQYPASMRLARNAFPRLNSLAVPPAALAMILPELGCSLEHLTLTDIAVRDGSQSAPLIKFLTVEDISSLLKMLQVAGVKLRSLKFNLRTFERELFYMLAAKQKNITELCIAYQYGETNDVSLSILFSVRLTQCHWKDFFMSVGTKVEFPYLERFHLYRFGDRMAGKDASAFVDHKEYVIIWQRSMPNLREVVLSPDVIWMRVDPVVTLPPSVSGSFEAVSSLTTMEARNERHRRPKAYNQWARYAISPQPLDGVEGLLVIPCPKDARRFEAVGRERRTGHAPGTQYQHMLAQAMVEHQAHAAAQLQAAGQHFQFLHDAAEEMMLDGEELQDLPMSDSENEMSDGEEHLHVWMM